LHGDASSAKHRHPVHHFGISYDRFRHESIVVQIPVETARNTSPTFRAQLRWCPAGTAADSPYNASGLAPPSD
jgi:hypothetical protein